MTHHEHDEHDEHYEPGEREGEEDFLERAAEHARRMAEQLGRQEASVQRFLELSGDDFAEGA